MSSKTTIKRLESELEAVESAISRVQRGEFETRRGDRSFVMPSLAELRREKNRLRRAIGRCRGQGVRQAVPRERRRGYR